MDVKQSVRVMVGMAVAGSLIATSSAAEEVSLSPTIQPGSLVRMDYTLKVEGQVVDTSEGRGPLGFTQGKGQIIPGLERELDGLQVGDKKQVTVKPEEGYGLVDQAAYIEFPKAQLPPNLKPEEGAQLRGTSPDGRPFTAVIHKIGENTVTLDLNHPLAGKTLEFEVAIVEVLPSE